MMKTYDFDPESRRPYGLILALSDRGLASSCNLHLGTCNSRRTANSRSPLQEAYDFKKEQ
jgi:hypothetical protein